MEQFGPRHARMPTGDRVADERGQQLEECGPELVNTVLVAAALLGGVTLYALLQPSGAAFGYDALAVLIFWTYNCMYFYFSIYTILCCRGTSITTQ